MNDTPAPLQQLAEIRREFPGTDKWIYFETSARGLLPAGAREAVARYLDDRILEGGSRTTMLDVLERVRGKFAHLIGAEPDEIAIVKNVSEGINAIVTALPWQRGENAVLCTDIEHPNSIYALYNMRDRYGILIGTGLDKLRTSTVRIGTMAMTASPMYVLPTLSALELALRDLGAKPEPGAGVAAAQTVFANAG